jgi:hypothetical protein
MQQAGVPMLYDSASNPRLPCLYICPVANVLGRAPLIPCFICGNSHPTIPNSFKDNRPASWKRLRRHAAGQGEQQQALRGEHLDVALRQGPPPDGVHCPSQMLRGSGASASARAGPGQQRLRSDAARPLLRPALPRMTAELIKVLVMISYLISYTISYHISI